MENIKENFNNSNLSAHTINTNRIQFSQCCEECDGEETCCENCTNCEQSYLNYYEKYTHTTFFTGAINSDIQNVIIERIGTITHLMFPSILLNSNSASSIDMVSALPKKFRPLCVNTNNIYQIITIKDNGINLIGTMKLSNDGNIKIYVGLNEELLTGLSIVGKSGFDNLSVSYICQ